MGTSAGALTGALYCAGYTPRQVAKHLSENTPATLLRPSLTPWRGGALSLEGVVARLRDLLPPRFEDLQREFAVGVVTADGRHLLIDSGPLPEAVAASAAIPFVFQAVDVPGRSRHGPFKDGGVVDRVGLKAWRDRRRVQMKQQHGYNGSVSPRPPTCLVHVIERSSPFSGSDDMTSTGESHILVVKSPRSGANFFDLGAFDDTMSLATERAMPQLHRLRTRRNSGGSVQAPSAAPAAATGTTVHANGLAVNGAAVHANGLAVNGAAVHVNGLAVNGAVYNGLAVAAIEGSEEPIIRATLL